MKPVLTIKNYIHPIGILAILSQMKALNI